MNSENVQNTWRRFSSIDLLKIISMFLIVIVHIITHYAPIDIFPSFSAQDITIYYIKTICAVAVNCFAMASGFILIHKQIRFSKLIFLWFQIEFYSITILAIFYLFEYCGIIENRVPFSYSQMFTSVFPINRNSWWYASCYVGMYMVLPILNPLLSRIKKKHFHLFFIIGFICLSILPFITYEGDGLGIKHGYSIIWIIAMYIVGSYFRLYQPKKNLHPFLLFVLVVSIVGSMSLFLDRFVVGRLFEGKKIIDFFNLYISPFTILTSILLFYGFVSLDNKINNKGRFGRFLSLISRLTFGIYLIHTHDIIWDYFKNCLIFLENMSTLIMLLTIVAVSLVVFIVCGLIDFLRQLLFKLLRIKQLSEKLSAFLVHIANRLLVKNDIADFGGEKNESNSYYTI